MNRLALVALLATTACNKDTASATPTDAVAPAPAPAPAATEPAAAEPTPAEPTPAEPETPTEPEPDTADTIPSGPAKPIDDPAEGLTEPKDFAVVKLEVKQTNKKVYKDTTGKIIEWDVPTKVEVDFDGHKHAFVVTAKRSGKTGVAIEIDYAVDGADVIRSADLESKLKERGVLLIEGGGAIAVTVSNKKVKPKVAPPKDTIKQTGGKDPLSGAKEDAP
jgi:hypothetical protein